jgi:hypothetical protein
VDAGTWVVVVFEGTVGRASVVVSSDSIEKDVLAVVVGGAVVGERMDEMIFWVVMGIVGRPEKSRSGFVVVVGHLVVGAGLLLKRMELAGLRLSRAGPQRGLQTAGLGSIGRLDVCSADAKTRPANVLGSCWERQVGVGSVRSGPRRSVEILAIATVVG